MVPPDQHHTDAQKLNTLATAVHSLEPLRTIKTQAETHETLNGSTLSFEDYLTLLESAATRHDASLTTRTKPTRSSRAVYNAHTENDVQEDPFSEEEAFNIDVPFQDLQISATATQPATRPVRMPFDRWKQLSDADKARWDEFDDPAKAIILGADAARSQPRLPSAGLQGSNTRPGLPVARRGPSGNRRANLHDVSVYDLIMAHVHEFGGNQDDDPHPPHTSDEFHDAQEPPAELSPATEYPDDDEAARFLINAAKTGRLPPGDIRRILSQPATAQPSTSNTKAKKSVTVVKQHVTYRVSAHMTQTPRSLVDRGANGGVAGKDVRVIFKTPRSVNIQGIDNHQLCDVDIGTVGGVTHTQDGPVILIMHQYALFGKGRTIHAPGQMEWNGLSVDDRSVHAGGRQRIKTPDGYTMPLAIHNGLPYLTLRPFTDQEWDELPHVLVSQESLWDPTVLDHTFDSDEQWFDAATDVDPDPSTNLFDAQGNHRLRVHVAPTQVSPTQHLPLDLSSEDDICAAVDQCVHFAHWERSHASLPFLDAHAQETAPLEIGSDDLDIVGTALPPDAAPNALVDGEPPTVVSGEPRVTSPKEPDFEKLRPFFAWLSPDIIRETFKRTTQMASPPHGEPVAPRFQVK